ncbi:hypothetical protein [Brunnivagina elsteri]|nr:hypothetical protein [Calothrix elsteri]
MGSIWGLVLSDSECIQNRMTFHNPESIDAIILELSKLAKMYRKVKEYCD